MPSRIFVLADTWVHSFAADIVTIAAATAFTSAAAQIFIPVPGSPAPVIGQTFAGLGWSRTLVRVGVAYLTGSVVIYSFGAVGLSLVTGQSLSSSIENGATPFLSGYLMKAALAAGLLPVVSRGPKPHHACPTALDCAASTVAGNSM